MAARWLRAVANARAHATTGAVPAERLAVERARRPAVPPPQGAGSPREGAKKPRARPIVGLQHPLAFRDAFARAGR